MVPTPVALGLVLCDTVVVEEKTKKASLIGTFAGIKVNEFPATAPPFSVFAVLVDGQGRATIKLSVLRLDSNEEVYAYDSQVHFPDPLAEVRFHLRLHHCVFPAAGTYQFTLLVDGEWVAQRRIRVYSTGGATRTFRTRTVFHGTIPRPTPGHRRIASTPFTSLRRRGGTRRSVRVPRRFRASTRAPDRRGNSRPSSRRPTAAVEPADGMPPWRRGSVPAEGSCASGPCQKTPMPTKLDETVRQFGDLVARGRRFLDAEGSATGLPGFRKFLCEARSQLLRLLPDHLARLRFRLDPIRRWLIEPRHDLLRIGRVTYDEDGYANLMAFPRLKDNCSRLPSRGASSPRRQGCRSAILTSFSLPTGKHDLSSSASTAESA
jgi:hypothetical protein